jgi:hypothetical protein
VVLKSVSSEWTFSLWRTSLEQHQGMQLGFALGLRDAGANPRERLAATTRPFSSSTIAESKSALTMNSLKALHQTVTD